MLPVFSFIVRILALYRGTITVTLKTHQNKSVFLFGDSSFRDLLLAITAEEERAKVAKIASDEAERSIAAEKKAAAEAAARAAAAAAAASKASIVRCKG